MEVFRLIGTLSLIFIFLQLLIGILEVNGGTNTTTQTDKETQAGNVSSTTVVVPKKSRKKPTRKPLYKWRPKENTKLELAKQKGLSDNQIPDMDPEFEFLWADDYYDNYDFEHTRNMIQHGTWEALRQNYHEADLKEAKEALKREKEANTNDP